ncbi:uncharacterized protein [Panulirus ornatus]|uniref:uncharacterized protein n=1 Tax=Panulirus ornatus TaxID=150431 RepID=UPI003A8850A5
MERLSASLRTPRSKPQSSTRKTLGFPHSRIADKYGMRPRTIIRRLLQEKRLREAPQKLVKSRPQPVSKYRKAAARSRQRSHVQQINQAFENLRNVLPAAARCRRDASAAAKMTILRLALRYIAALTHLLQEDDTQRCQSNDEDTSSSCSHTSTDDHKPRPSDCSDLKPQQSTQEDEDETSEDTYMLALAKIFDENDDSSDSNTSDGDKDEAEYHSDSGDPLSDREAFSDLSDQEVEEQLHALADLGHLSEGETDPLILS